MRRGKTSTLVGHKAQVAPAGPPRTNKGIIDGDSAPTYLPLPPSHLHSLLLSPLHFLLTTILPFFFHASPSDFFPLFPGTILPPSPPLISSIYFTFRLHLHPRFPSSFVSFPLIRLPPFLKSSFTFTSPSHPVILHIRSPFSSLFPQLFIFLPLSSHLLPSLSYTSSYYVFTTHHIFPIVPLLISSPSCPTQPSIISLQPFFPSFFSRPSDSAICGLLIDKSIYLSIPFGQGSRY